MRLACLALSLIASLVLPAFSYAQVQSAGIAAEIVASASTSREDRKNTQYSILANYSYFDTWVPSKYGAAFVFNFGPSDAAEFSYDHGGVGYDYFKVSIGRVSDDRFTVLWRHYGLFNSFNLVAGLHHSNFRVQLGSDLLRSVPGGDTGGVNVVEISTLGPTIGFGNRWQTKGGFVWSFDWLLIHFPLWTLKERTAYLSATHDPVARKDVDDAVKLLKGTPSASMVKAQLGYAF